MIKAFDFQCVSCQNKFEKFVDIEKENVVCPECGAHAERLISPPRGFVLKGEGFYCNSRTVQAERVKKKEIEHEKKLEQFDRDHMKSWR